MKMTNIGELRTILSDMIKDLTKEDESSILDFQKDICQRKIKVLQKCNDDLMEIGKDVGKRMLFEMEKITLYKHLGPNHPIFKGSNN